MTTGCLAQTDSEPEEKIVTAESNLDGPKQVVAPSPGDPAPPEGNPDPGPDHDQGSGPDPVPWHEQALDTRGPPDPWHPSSAIKPIGSQGK